MFRPASCSVINFLQAVLEEVKRVAVILFPLGG